MQRAFGNSQNGLKGATNDCLKNSEWELTVDRDEQLLFLYSFGFYDIIW